MFAPCQHFRCRSTGALEHFQFDSSILKLIDAVVHTGYGWVCLVWLRQAMASLVQVSKNSGRLDINGFAQALIDLDCVVKSHLCGFLR